MSSSTFPPAMRRLVSELMKLPSIGEKSAIRLAYYLLTRKAEESNALAKAIVEAREKTSLCQNCYSLSESAFCAVCSDSRRLQSILCVVEKPADVIALERSGGYRGLYHVLHGLWSPLRGVGPEQTRMRELFERIRSSIKQEDRPPIEEVVLATSATVEGDATAMYIAKTLHEVGIKATRIAQGLPKGGELEYADEITLSHAIEGRRSI